MIFLEMGHKGRKPVVERLVEQFLIASVKSGVEKTPWDRVTEAYMLAGEFVNRSIEYNKKTEE